MKMALYASMGAAFLYGCTKVPGHLFRMATAPSYPVHCGACMHDFRSKGRNLALGSSFSFDEETVICPQCGTVIPALAKMGKRNRKNMERSRVEDARMRSLFCFLFPSTFLR